MPINTATLVPGLAFTPNGEWLGYGAGYYDRLIASCGQKPRLVAAASATQIVGTMPCAVHDQNVDCIVTEDAIYGELHQP
jgi:5-formyltetrahydrofolate cyclo-ligase